MEKKQWSSNLLFLITAIGTEAGIANFWKFTYLAGQNGGAAFVFVYFVALATLAVPALIADMLIGRYCGRSVAGCMRLLVERDRVSPAWKSYGAIALTGIFLVLSFYFVVCGWMLRYFVLGLSGSFVRMQPNQAVTLYENMLASPGWMLACSGFFILLTTLIVAHGVNKGIERVSGILTPLRFVILIGLCAYASIVGDTRAAAEFLLSFHFDRLTWKVILAAVGQAFFSLGVGAGVLMTVGALIVTGTATNVCVESTARDAMMLDFRVFMPHDATAALDQDAHLAGVRSVMQSFADVRPVDALLALIDKAPT